MDRPSTPAGTAPRISFEFFPPRTARASMTLWESVQRLAPLAPSFVSVTYGAGGTTRDRTMAAILAIRDCAGLEVAGHLTCVGATRDEVMRVARSYGKLGCRRIVALRGDPPRGEGRFTPHPDGFAGSVELVAALAGLGQFQISVACYPEVHPEAASARSDIDHLKRKLDAGATAAITQFFLDNASFHRFRDACAAAGIDAPIIPGILPIENFDKLVGFARWCKAEVPEWMFDAYDRVGDDAAHDRLSVEIATRQCEDLLAHGVTDLHFYTLNKAGLVHDVCRALGVEPEPATLAAGSA